MNKFNGNEVSNLPINDAINEFADVPSNNTIHKTEMDKQWNKLFNIESIKKVFDEVSVSKCDKPFKQENTEKDDIISKLVNEISSEVKQLTNDENPEETYNKEPLSEEEKKMIMDETGWSKEIVDCIRNMEEYEKVYKNANLTEMVINDKHCLVKKIDMDYIDPKSGKTNRELMSEGRSPIDSETNERIELHHMGQDKDSPLAELCENSEHGDGNDKILHDKKCESWRQNPDDKNYYNNVERPNHWKARAMEA